MIDVKYLNSSTENVATKNLIYLTAFKITNGALLLMLLHEAQRKTQRKSRNEKI